MWLNKYFAESYKWLCRSRAKHPPNADIWDFRWSWEKTRDKIIDAFSDGSYRFDVQSRMKIKNGEEIDINTPSDALVLKVLTKIIEKIIMHKITRRCYHIRGNGGLKKAIMDILKNKSKYNHVIRTDIKSYYDSIDQQILIEKLANHIYDKKIIKFILQYMKRTVSMCEGYVEIKKGLPMGSPLSPLLGGFYLRELDDKIEQTGVFYIRYMDDILIMAETRWMLRNAIKVLTEELEVFGLKQHPR